VAEDEFHWPCDGIVITQQARLVGEDSFVDATVFGHLKDFDVSSDLSMNVKPNFNPTTRTPGLTFTFSPKKPEHKLYEVR
jgi:hypothetical protein